MLLVCIQFESIETLYSSKSLWISSQFDTENYSWRLDIVFLSVFGTFLPKFILGNI